MHKIETMNTSNISAADSSTPLSEQAFRSLRHDVLIGTFEAGSKLKLDELQGHYGFSSSPLREALSRLAQEGLVRADERRGFRVAPISSQDLNDITHMRLMLDVPALRSAIESGDDAWEGAIVATFHRLEKVESRLSDGPVILDEEWSEVHRTFHSALIAACASERQRVWSASLFDQAERYRRFSARHRQAGRRKSNEHRKIMDATLRRDTDTACALLGEHILSTQRNVEAAMKRAAGV
ncbi:FCD domain-containing protein [Variovorax sp. YR266]|uniref:FCD domain-containing protein n=1 Tax=Variovorax sp. YR266 TaxID=1884386 RepID=UPI000B8334EE|nr:FCD domain-containing protein [Variovorax sp. YR266]